MTLANYNSHIVNTLNNTEVTHRQQAVELQDGLSQLLAQMQLVKQNTRKVILIGNGGSAAIASHIATDFWKRGGIRAIAFSDASLITCVSNDFSYAEVYSKPIAQFADEHDLLIAISSSGNSENILNAVKEAKKQGCITVTLSGFSSANLLRTLGDINFYVPGKDYGCVEIGHLILLHYLIDSFLTQQVTRVSAGLAAT